jgi:hydroxymethylpyrimidine pyrophosphatase-like HAD family hydrolase
MKDKIVFVDIDETICFYKKDIPLDGKKDYNLAVPDYLNIEKINKLYENGCTIVYWTARGSRSGIDWTEFTNKQLTSWGAKFHEIRCTKPYYDIFIEDRSVRIEELK